jgi:hypothetical protein
MFKEIWAGEGRSDAPRIGADCYVSLGPGGREHAATHLLSFYASAGPATERLAASAITDEAKLRDVVDEYAVNGCDELVLLSCTADPGHLDRIAGVVLR